MGGRSLSAQIPDSCVVRNIRIRQLPVIKLVLPCCRGYVPRIPATSNRVQTIQTQLKGATNPSLICIGRQIYPECSASNFPYGAVTGMSDLLSITAGIEYTWIGAYKEPDCRILKVLAIVYE